VSDEPRRVSVIREVAIADSFVLVGGYPAWYLGRVLRGFPGGLEALLVRSGIPPERRDDVLRAVGALVHVGTAWRLDQERGSGSGTNVDEGADPHAPSRRGLLLSTRGSIEASTSRAASPVLGTSEVASALGVSPRMVRRLAATGDLPGHRDAGGRWQFTVADVAAERERRMTGTRRADAAA
jgi:excisionase family DNA binding protein